MSRAAQLRTSLESSLEHRIPSAFSPPARIELPTISSGIAEVDALLGGGLPVGAITEVVGSLSSGRLTCASAFIAQVMQTGHVCAWIDVSDSFDPESAASNGIALSGLLWVRCGNSATESRSSKPASSVAVSTHGGATQPPQSGSSPHPRNEERGLSQALDTLLSRKPIAARHKQIGTPGMSNRSLEGWKREEQVAFDRLPARRGSNLKHNRRQATRLSNLADHVPRHAPVSQSPKTQRPWSRLDQALRATDLIMQAGGFGALVLDLGDVEPQFASRIPLATWFRFRAAAERTRTAFLLLSQHACAHSSAEIVLRTSLMLPEAGTVMKAIPFCVELVRQRFPAATNNVISMRKPSARASIAHWSVGTSWMAGR